MEKKKTRKRKKFPKKIIAASLLAMILIVNFVYSSLQNVKARGIFINVENKVTAANEGNKPIKILEVLPDSTSLSVMNMLIDSDTEDTVVGANTFQNVIKNYSNEEIEAFAEMLAKYGIVNMDSASSSIYPLTYYKPGDQDRISWNEPVLPEDKKGYALVEKQLVTGYYQEVSKEELAGETVYYQEIPVSVTPIPTETPTQTPEGTPVPTESAEQNVTPKPTETLVSPDVPDGPSPTPIPEGTPYFVNENDTRVYLNYNEDGLNDSTKEGRFFRFIAAEAGKNPPEGAYYSGYGYRFIFGSKAEIRHNDLFTRFVLGIDKDTPFNKKNLQLKTVSVETMTGEDLSQYDLVYIAQPIFYLEGGTVFEWPYASPKLTEDEKKAHFSPWVTMAGAQSSDNIRSAAMKILEGMVNEVTPLKLVVDTSVLDEYERAVTLYSETSATLEGTSVAADLAADLENIYGSEIYKMLLMVAQDDFTAKMKEISTAAEIAGTDQHTYTVNSEKWKNEVASEDLRAALSEAAGEAASMFVRTNGHYVNKNVYFYKHNISDYNNVEIKNDTSIVSMVNGDFRSILKKDVAAKGFADVISAIDSENEHSAFMESSREKINAEEISADLILQYLLSYEGKTIEIKKNTISVLEIEPCADFTYVYNEDGSMSENQKSFVEKWIKYFAEQKRYQDVTFTCMSMQEFIGKNEDLNATYDMIYIGSNIGKFQTVNNDNNTRRFNDTSMNGLVYTHIGDVTGKKVTVGNGLGLLDSDYSDGAGRTKLNASRSTTMRTTGNDLTTYKKRDLLNFLASGYPVIVGENLLTYDEDGIPAAINADGQTQGDVITDTSDTRTVYIRKPKAGFHDAWDNIYLYAWNDGGKNAEYPGIKAAYEAGLSNGDYYVYRADVLKQYSSYKISGRDGANKERGTTGNQAWSNTKDVCTLTLKASGSSTQVTEAIGAPSGAASGTATVDNATYLYQLLKIATANEATVDTSKITRTTLNYEVGGMFDWENRKYPNLLVDKESVKDASAEVASCLNVTKVYLNLTKKPTEYGYDMKSVDGNPINEEKVNYLQPGSDGRYYLNYEFSISTLAGTLSTSDYDCKLYVDANFDGKFSENAEELDSIIIKEAATGKIITKTEGENVYHLKENTAYTLSRKLPRSFDGCINWKLQVTQNGKSEILASETGYSAIPVVAKKENGSVDTEKKKQVIRILQVTSGNSTAESSGGRITYNGTHVNLEEQLKSGAALPKWHNLLTNIPDFELKIDTMCAEDFASNCDSYNKSHPNDKGGYPLHRRRGETADNEGYDMIIVGFIDVFADVDKGGSSRAAAMAETMNRFGKAGRSILFTHDTTAWNGDYQKLALQSDYWKREDWYNDAMNSSAFLTVALRDLCGNDQFGIVTRMAEGNAVDLSSPANYINQFFRNTATTKAVATGKEYDRNTDTAAWSELLGLGKDMAFKPRSNQEKVVGETQGSTYTNLRAYNYQFNDNNPAANDANTFVQYIKGLIPSKRKNTDMFDSAADTIEKFEVGKVNHGAITEYPYQLPESFDVASTHGQYWTVDIESDNNGDEESDLVVWYCINKRSVKGNGTGAPADDFYKDTPNDVRNNYYIYNKGNVTYSGAGHSPISGEEEIKLFINTMIAAYNAQLKLPEINVVENGEPEAEELENIIIPYDTKVDSADVDFVNFGSGTDGTAGEVKLYFNVYDGNLVAKEKYIHMDKIFVTESGGSETYVDETTGITYQGKSYTTSEGMKIYDASNNKETAYDKLISGHSYYVKPKISDIFKKDQSVQCFFEIHTEIGSGSNLQKTASVKDSVTVSRAEIFDLD